MLRRAGVLIALVAGCASSPPPAPPVAELDIKKMPDAGAPLATPKAVEKLQRLYGRHRDRVDIIAVSVDDEKTGVFAVAKQLGVAFTVAWDEGHHAAECWKVQTMPSTYIVDREGVVRHLHSGYHDGEVDEMEREIEKL